MGEEESSSSEETSGTRQGRIDCLLSILGRIDKEHMRKKHTRKASMNRWSAEVGDGQRAQAEVVDIIHQVLMQRATTPCHLTA